ncbi:tetratricopeptide repeat protein [Botryobacter ruber]|uniref:tetratricopeptide repeat protein n=1 Tax=Botryobacter ruber TaxID=2171629 RepID=UPI000E0AF8F1|nr:tetratricopeptide repeat protein [Botryobacter ruber]
MKTLLLFILLAGFFGGSIQTISQTNRYVREAAQAYEQQDFIYAIAAYEYLLNNLEVEDDQIRLNLAHAYYRSRNLEKARKQYQLLANHKSQRLRALAVLQLGNVAVQQQKFKNALSFYRSALIAEPGNESARYNYELLKKYLDLHPELLQEEEPEAPLSTDTTAAASPPPPPAAEEKETPAPKQKPDPRGTEQEETETQEQDQQGSQEDKSGAGNPKDRQPNKNEAGNQEKEAAAGQEKGDKLGQNPDSNANGQRQPSGIEPISEQDQRAQTQRARLEQMNLTPEKAQMLLDAMRNAELQYIQQLPRKATRKPDRSKPDW